MSADSSSLPPVLTPKEAASLLRMSVDSLLASDAPWLPKGKGSIRPRRLYVKDQLLEWARERAAA